MTETDDGVGVGPGGPVGPRRGNPALVIGGILIALLIVFLIFFGMNQSGDGDDGGDDGVRVTVPDELDQDGGNDADEGDEGGTTETTSGGDDEDSGTETTRQP
ncbi:MAG TPA: hypothetical protein VM933_10220 [Acidimicrobiales bacterium]|nr:hypothetical protein [Acidimicrobiales bacterium]